ncbi:MAG: hypothetical protein ACRDZ4_17045 [Egibacteraceae bacterium]
MPGEASSKDYGVRLGFLDRLRETGGIEVEVSDLDDLDVLAEDAAQLRPALV